MKPPDAFCLFDPHQSTGLDVFVANDYCRKTEPGRYTVYPINPRLIYLLSQVAIVLLLARGPQYRLLAV